MDDAGPRAAAQAPPRDDGVAALADLWANDMTLEERARIASPELPRGPSNGEQRGDAGELPLFLPVPADSEDDEETESEIELDMDVDQEQEEEWTLPLQSQASPREAVSPPRPDGGWSVTIADDAADDQEDAAFSLAVHPRTERPRDDQSARAYISTVPTDPAATATSTPASLSERSTAGAVRSESSTKVQASCNDALLLRTVLEHPYISTTARARIAYWDGVVHAFNVAGGVGVASRTAVTRRIAVLTLTLFESPHRLTPSLCAMVLEFNERNYKAGFATRLGDAFLTVLRRHANDGEPSASRPRLPTTPWTDYERMFKMQVAEDECLLQIVFKHKPFEVCKTSRPTTWAQIYDDYSAALGATDWVRGLLRSPVACEHRVGDMTAALLNRAHPSHAFLSRTLRAMLVELHLLIIPASAETIAADTDKLFMRIVLEKRPFDAVPGTRHKVWETIAQAFTTAGGEQIKNSQSAIRRITTLTKMQLERPEDLSQDLRVMVLRYHELCYASGAGGKTDMIMLQRLRKTVPEILTTIGETSQPSGETVRKRSSSPQAIDSPGDNVVDEQADETQDRGVEDSTAAETNENLDEISLVGASVGSVENTEPTEPTETQSETLGTADSTEVVEGLSVDADTVVAMEAFDVIESSVGAEAVVVKADTAVARAEADADDDDDADAESSPVVGVVEPVLMEVAAPVVGVQVSAEAVAPLTEAVGVVEAVEAVEEVVEASKAREAAADSDGLVEPTDPAGDATDEPARETVQAVAAGAEFEFEVETVAETSASLEDTSAAVSDAAEPTSGRPATAITADEVIHAPNDELFMRTVLTHLPVKTTFQARTFGWDVAVDAFVAAGGVNVASRVDATKRIGVLTLTLYESPHLLTPHLRKLVLDFIERSYKAGFAQRLGAAFVATLRRHAIEGKATAPLLATAGRHLNADQRKVLREYAREDEKLMGLVVRYRPFEAGRDGKTSYWKSIVGTYNATLEDVHCSVRGRLGSANAAQQRVRFAVTSFLDRTRRYHTFLTPALRAMLVEFSVLNIDIGNEMQQPVQPNHAGAEAIIHTPTHSIVHAHLQTGEPTAYRTRERLSEKRNLYAVQANPPVLADSDASVSHTHATPNKRVKTHRATDELFMRFVLENRPFDAKIGDKIRVWNHIADVYNAAGGDRVRNGHVAARRIVLLMKTMLKEPQLLTPTLRKMILEYHERNYESGGRNKIDKATLEMLRKHASLTEENTNEEDGEEEGMRAKAIEDECLVRLVTIIRPFDARGHEKKVRLKAVVAAYNASLNSRESATIRGKLTSTKTVSFRLRDLTHALYDPQNPYHAYLSPALRSMQIKLTTRKCANQDTFQLEPSTFAAEGARDVHVSTAAAAPPESRRVHIDEELMRLVIDTRPYVARESRAALWKAVADKLQKIIKTLADGQSVDAHSVRARGKWLVEVFSDREHEEHANLSPAVRSMLADYTKVNHTALRQLLTSLTKPTSPTSEENGETAAVQESLDDVLLREVLRIRFKAGQSKAAWDRVASTVNARVGTTVFTRGKSCKQRVQTLRSLYRDVKHAETLGTSEREKLMQLDAMLQRKKTETEQPRGENAMAAARPTEPRVEPVSRETADEPLQGGESVKGGSSGSGRCIKEKYDAWRLRQKKQYRDQLRSKRARSEPAPELEPAHQVKKTKTASTDISIGPRPPSAKDSGVEHEPSDTVDEPRQGGESERAGSSNIGGFTTVHPALDACFMRLLLDALPFCRPEGEKMVAWGQLAAAWTAMTSEDTAVKLPTGKQAIRRMQCLVAVYRDQTHREHPKLTEPLKELLREYMSIKATYDAKGYHQKKHYRDELLAKRCRSEPDAERSPQQPSKNAKSASAVIPTISPSANASPVTGSRVDVAFSGLDEAFEARGKRRASPTAHQVVRSKRQCVTTDSAIYGHGVDTASVNDSTVLDATVFRVALELQPFCVGYGLRTDAWDAVAWEVNRQLGRSAFYKGRFAHAHIKQVLARLETDPESIPMNVRELAAQYNALLPSPTTPYRGSRLTITAESASSTSPNLVDPETPRSSTRDEPQATQPPPKPQLASFRERTELAMLRDSVTRLSEQVTVLTKEVAETTSKKDSEVAAARAETAELVAEFKLERREFRVQQDTLVALLKSEREAQRRETQAMMAAIDRERKDRRDEFVAMTTNLMARNAQPSAAQGSQQLHEIDADLDSSE